MLILVVDASISPGSYEQPVGHLGRFQLYQMVIHTSVALLKVAFIFPA